MSKRDDLIQKYAADLRDKCGEEPDMDLLTKVTIALGPSIYDADAGTVSSGDPAELDRVKKSFLIGKLGLEDGPELDAALDKAVETYGRSNRQKHRAVIHYLLARHFGKEAVFG
jgi:hypothetical protein